MNEELDPPFLVKKAKYSTFTSIVARSAKTEAITRLFDGALLVTRAWKEIETRARVRTDFRILRVQESSNLKMEAVGWFLSVYIGSTKCHINGGC